jgi:hypothetical protein
MDEIDYVIYDNDGDLRDFETVPLRVIPEMHRMATLQLQNVRAQHKDLSQRWSFMGNGDGERMIEIMISRFEDKISDHDHAIETMENIMKNHGVTPKPLS